jgi:hypothetical protein
MGHRQVLDRKAVLRGLCVEDGNGVPAIVRVVIDMGDFHALELLHTPDLLAEETDLRRVLIPPVDRGVEDIRKHAPNCASPINAGTAEPCRVSPPEAVAYPLELSRCPQRYPFRGSMTRPASSFHPAPYAHGWVCTWMALLPCWRGFDQVGLAPSPVLTHWVTTTNFMGLLPIPRSRAYLGATSAWFGWVCGKGGPTRSNMQRLEKPPQ